MCALDSFVVECLASRDTEVLRAIAEVELQAWGREVGAQAVAAKLERLADELEQLNPASKAISIGRASGDVVGVGRVTAWHGNPDEWMVYGVAVSPDHQRQGIGRALVDACVAYARDHGASRIISQAHADNRESIAFHEALGFRNDGRFTAEDGDELVRFSLDARQHNSSSQLRGKT